MSAIEWYLKGKEIFLSAIEKVVEDLLLGHDQGVKVWLDNNGSFNPVTTEGFDSWEFDYELYEIAVKSLFKAIDMKVSDSDIMHEVENNEVTLMEEVASVLVTVNKGKIYDICKNYIVDNF